VQVAGRRFGLARRRYRRSTAPLPAQGEPAAPARSGERFLQWGRTGLVVFPTFEYLSWIEGRPDDVARDLASSDLRPATRADGPIPDALADRPDPPGAPALDALVADQYGVSPEQVLVTAGATNANALAFAADRNAIGGHVYDGATYALLAHDHLDGDELTARALDAGVLVVPGRFFDRPDAVRVSLGRPTDQATAALDALGTVLDEIDRQPGPTD
jgi:aspartate/methionine/tyrosine aminotransferase